MEPLENKLERMSPEQRREVEDFIDFMLCRAGIITTPDAILPAASSLVEKIAPPPFPVMEPVPVPQLQPFREAVSPPREGEVPGDSGECNEAALSPIQEIATAGNDVISRDYMDYGVFEQSSPAIAAVKKVKEKMSQKNEYDRARNLLDWID